METEKITRLERDTMGRMTAQEMLNRLPAIMKHLPEFGSGWKWEVIDSEDVDGITDGWLEIHCVGRDCEPFRTLKGWFIQSRISFVTYAVYTEDGDTHEVAESLSLESAVFEAWVYVMKQRFMNKLCEDAYVKSIAETNQLVKDLK